MSSILKALEKVEESQAKRSSGPSGLVRARQRRSPWVIAGAVLGGAAVAALATFAGMGGFSRHAPRQSEQAVNAPPAVVALPEPAVAQPKQAPVAAQPAVSASQAAAPPAAVKPAAAKAAAAKVATVKAASPGKSATGKANAGTAKAAAAKPATGKPATAKREAAKPAKAANAKAAAKSTVKEQGKEHRKATAKASITKAKHEKAQSAKVENAARKREHTTPVASRSAAPLPAVPAKPAPVAVAKAQPEKPRGAPRVTGIAWQKDSVSSVAMVNGRPVQQGGTVDGYKVEQIYEDKVRFSGANGRVEIPLGGGE
jgi:general secretion pathway protein B